MTLEEAFKLLQKEHPDGENFHYEDGELFYIEEFDAWGAESDEINDMAYDIFVDAYDDLIKVLGEDWERCDFENEHDFVRFSVRRKVKK